MAEEDKPEEQSTEEPTEETVVDVADEKSSRKMRRKKEKKLIRRRVSKKEKLSSVHAALRMAVETGKVDFGTRSAIRRALTGKVRVLVLSVNAPTFTREAARRYCDLSNVPLLEFDGSSLALGSICGRPYPVSLLSVHELGSSNLLDLVPSAKEKKGSHA